MKRILFYFFVAAVSLSACNTTKKATRQPTDVVEGEGTKPADVDHGSAQTTIERVTGIVRVEENCGAMIEVAYGDVIYRYFPLNLDPKYKKDGLRLKFAFKESDSKDERAQKCEVVNGIITVSDVTPVR